MNVMMILMGIVLLAMFCQWLAWKTRLPAILYLLAAGIICGPLSAYLFHNNGFIDPVELFGDKLLYPFDIFFLIPKVYVKIL